MKVLLLFVSMLAGASAFGVNIPKSMVSGKMSSSTVLRESIPEEMWTDEIREIQGIMRKWKEVKMMDVEDVEATLEPEWVEAYKRYHDEWDENFKLMQEIANFLDEKKPPPKKKTKGQKKRDKWALVQARRAEKIAFADALAGKNKKKKRQEEPATAE